MIDKKKKMLLITSALPYPPVTGEKIRNYNLIKYFSCLYDIYILSLISRREEILHLDKLAAYCCYIDYVELKKKKWFRHIFGLICFMLRGIPLETKFVYLNEMRSKIGQLTKKEQFDIIQIEHSFMAQYISDISDKCKAKKILEFLDIGWVQNYRILSIQKNKWRKLRYWLNWLLMKKWEPSIADKYDLCIVMSEKDKKELEKKNPRLKIAVVPNGVDTNLYQPLLKEKDNKNIVYIGTMDYEANVDGVVYFYENIWPLIVSQATQTKFFIVGNNPTARIKKLENNKNVFVTGYVKDVKECYRNSAVAIIPLRSGSGTRLKILEAMALGRPVVSTTIGCEGLDVEHGKHIFISDDPVEFAKLILELLNNQICSSRISLKARELVEERYAWEKIYETLNSAYCCLISNGI